MRECETERNRAEFVSEVAVTNERSKIVLSTESQSVCEQQRRNKRIPKMNNKLRNRRTSTYNNNIMPVRIYEKLRNIIVVRCRVGHVIEKPRRTERANVVSFSLSVGRRFPTASTTRTHTHPFNYAPAHRCRPPHKRCGTLPSVVRH